MKRILFILVAILFLMTPAFAETMAVQALDSISTDTPNKIVRVQVIRDCTLGGIGLKIGYVLEGKMMSVTGPKRLKQDASFTFAPLNYYDLNGNRVHIPKLYMGTYSAKFEINPEKLAKSAVLTVGNHFLKGLKTGVYAVEGAVNNEDGNRAVSAVHNVYENSLFSYVEKGGALNIPKETCFGLKFDECVNEKDN